MNHGEFQPQCVKLLSETVTEIKPVSETEMKPAAAKARKQAPAPLDLRGKDLDEAIQALTIKKQTSKESFSPADLKELKRLRNIRGSRNFRQKSKEFKKETAK